MAAVPGNQCENADMAGTPGPFKVKGKSEKYHSNLALLLETIDQVEYTATGNQDDYNSDEEDVAVMDPLKWKRDTLATVPDTTTALNRAAAAQAQAASGNADLSAHAPAAVAGVSLVGQRSFAEVKECFVGRRMPIQRPRKARQQVVNNNRTDLAEAFSELVQEFNNVRIQHVRSEGERAGEGRAASGEAGVQFRKKKGKARQHGRERTGQLED